MRSAAVISPRMRNVVSGGAGRCLVCAVSGRGRPAVQDLMGVYDLVVPGSHGFEIWSPRDELESMEEVECLVDGWAR